MAVLITQEVIRAIRITRIIVASGLLVNYFSDLTSALYLTKVKFGIVAHELLLSYQLVESIDN